MRYPTDTTLADLIRTERLLPGRLANGAHGTVRLDAGSVSRKESTANAVRSVLDSKVYADGPRGCTVMLDQSDVREWLATNRPHARPEAWDIGGTAFNRWALENATRDAADRIRRALPGLTVITDLGRIVVRARGEA